MTDADAREAIARYTRMVAPLAGDLNGLPGPLPGLRWVPARRGMYIGDIAEDQIRWTENSRRFRPPLL